MVVENIRRALHSARLLWQILWLLFLTWQMLCWVMSIAKPTLDQISMLMQTLFLGRPINMI